MGIKISEMTLRQLIILFAVLLSGSSGVVALDAFTGGKSHTMPVIDEGLVGEINKRIDSVDGDISAIKGDIKSIKNTINKQIAREAALKAVESIKNKAKGIEMYNRIYDANIIRLSDGHEPCYTVDCVG